MQDLSIEIVTAASSHRFEDIEKITVDAANDLRAQIAHGDDQTTTISGADALTIATGGQHAASASRTHSRERSPSRVQRGSESHRTDGGNSGAAVATEAVEKGPSLRDPSPGAAPDARDADADQNGASETEASPSLDSVILANTWTFRQFSERLPRAWLPATVLTNGPDITEIRFTHSGTGATCLLGSYDTGGVPVDCYELLADSRQPITATAEDGEAAGWHGVQAMRAYHAGHAEGTDSDGDNAGESDATDGTATVSPGGADR